MGSHVLQSTRCAHDVMGCVKDSGICIDRNYRVFRRRMDERNVAPSAIVDLLPRLLQHLAALLDTDDSPCRADHFFDHRETETSAASGINNCITLVKRQAREIPSARLLRDESIASIVRFRVGSIFAQRCFAVGHFRLV